MPATPRPTRWVCLAMILAISGIAPFARAQSPEKAVSAVVIGPPVQLTPEQLSAIEAKRSADPAVRRGSPVASPRTAKPSEPLVRATPKSLAAAPATVAPPSKRITWPSISPSIGVIPRPSWTAPWLGNKPADVTISRPLRAADAAGRAPGADSTRGPR